MSVRYDYEFACIISLCDTLRRDVQVSDVGLKLTSGRVSVIQYDINVKSNEITRN